MVTKGSIGEKWTSLDTYTQAKAEKEARNRDENRKVYRKSPNCSGSD